MANGLQLQACPHTAGHILKHHQQGAFVLLSWQRGSEFQRDMPVRPSARFQKTFIGYLVKTHLLPGGTHLLEEWLGQSVDLNGKNLLRAPANQAQCAPWLRAE